jgi:antitoxin component of RelBE/YafQ-DinJ toxin-antitoxin module
MATLSLRIRDSLKRKAQDLARRQGVSLNNFINATVAAAVAQEEALAYFEDRLRDQDLEALHRRVLAFMEQTRPGPEPSPEDLSRALGGSRHPVK